MKRIQCVVFLTVVLLLASVSTAQEEISAGDVLSQKEFIDVSSQHEIVKEKIAGGVKSLVLPTPHANVSNDYISIVVARGYYTGTYTMGTTGGDPTRTGDENKLLLYGHPNPWSSYLTVRIDGTNYVTQNGAMNSYWISGPNVTGGNSITTVWKIGDIEVTQIISITTSASTGYPDTGLFRIRLRNTGTMPHSVGARFLFDTMLGSNDAAPFQVPGIGNVTSEREFNSNNMPPYWQAFDSLSNPTVISQGTLATSTPPNRFILANWGRLYSAPWNYTVLTGYANGDSAAAVYWFPVTLASGATVEYVTAYGLGGVTMSPGVLSIGLSAPLNTSSTGNFTVTAYVQNTGQSAANGVNATISLPSGLSLASGETAVKPIGDLASNSTGLASWVAQANGIPGTYNYSVTATSQNTNSTTAYRTITVTVPESAVVIKINNAAASPNANTSTQIVLNNMSDFGTANINLFYNASVVQVTSASLGFSGYGGSLTPNINNTIGKATFLITATDMPGPNSPLTLVNVGLQAVGSTGQISPLELSVLTLAHSDGTPVIPSVQNGIFNISSVIPGDVTGNGVVDAIDSMFLAQYVAGTRLTLPQQQAGDVALPCGSIDAIDSMFVAQYVAGTRPSLQLCS